MRNQYWWKRERFEGVLVGFMRGGEGGKGGRGMRVSGRVETRGLRLDELK